MASSYKSLYGQLVYTLLNGIPLLLIPNTVLAWAGGPPTRESWIRMFGLALIAVSVYYFAIARYGNPQLVWATIIGRLLFCSGLIIFVLTGLGAASLLGFALAEMALVTWSYWEVRKRSSPLSAIDKTAEAL